MKNLFKNPKTRVRNLLLLIAPFVIAVVVCVVISASSIKSISDNTSGTTTVSYKDSIDSMDYHLRANATDLQEELFHDLQDAINAEDKPQIAFLVCKNFVADFYTWTNKDGTFDVGGMYYVYSKQKTSIYNQARNTYYKYLSYYIDTFGAENLLEVESFDDENSSVDQTASTFEVDGETYESYSVTLKWNYKNLETFNSISKPTISGQETGFVDKLYFTVVLRDGRYEIVQSWGDL